MINLEALITMQYGMLHSHLGSNGNKTTKIIYLLYMQRHECFLKKKSLNHVIVETPEKRIEANP